MDVKVTDGPFGRSVQITDATSAQVAEVWATLSPPDAQVTKEDRAYVGQVIPMGTRFIDLPKGVRILDDGSAHSPYRHTSACGSRFQWSPDLDPKSDLANETQRSSRLWVDMTVKEIW